MYEYILSGPLGWNKEEETTTIDNKQQGKHGSSLHFFQQLYAIWAAKQYDDKLVCKGKVKSKKKKISNQMNFMGLFLLIWKVYKYGGNDDDDYKW